MKKTLFLLKETMNIERMGILYLAGTLKKHECPVYLLLTGNKKINKLINYIEEIKPDIIAYSVMTGEHNYYLNLNRFLKQRFQFLSVWGGPHPTFVPDFIEEEGVDAICRGEGEYPFLNLAQHLSNHEDFFTTSNFIFKNNGKIIKNDICKLINNLDDIPFSYREIIYAQDKHLRNNVIKTFFTQRGCPNNCKYCFNHKLRQIYKGKGAYIRSRSVKNFIKEVKDVISKYSLELIDISDDNFLFHSDEWLEEFSNRFPKEVKINFFCNFNLNLLTEERLKLLKRAGCVYVSVALETADDNINQSLLGRNINKKIVLEKVKILHKYRMKFQMDNLIGLPVKNSLQTDFKTLDFNIKIKPTFSLASILFPYPGTKIYEYTSKKGYIDKKILKKINSNPDKIFTRSYSIFQFQNSRINKKLFRFHKLFGITCAFPKIFRSLLPLLISLPFDKLFTFIFYAWHGFSNKFRLAVTRSSYHSLFHNLKLILKYTRNTQYNR